MNQNDTTPDRDEIESRFERIDDPTTVDRNTDYGEQVESRLIAEGRHKWDDRVVEIYYSIKTVEDSNPVLEVFEKYFRSDRSPPLLENQSETWSMTDGVVDHSGEGPRDFAESNFHADPQVLMGEAFDDVERRA